ncbi:hypothetical protein GCM10027515_18570 [Schumannella luteola]|uniref:Branched-subunit amino acid aminotransferase/4-amino-4-deoxychorismate lyase n=1 Tax=Schumannella luteola TaxID=472059 RepID=A0A852YK40_9MICO|nr:aminotransferase class IV [Schumannella luteola]NYH00348.1 branched-subunit amino acid aminotransferase/4-amino-4-deoxychorismate lyase [Schumannella luteola]TPX05967.1 hypothetical protein FJ656_03640 [Schumannella luteola]
MTTTFRWQNRELVAADDCEVVPARVDAADSWLVADGRARGLGLHRQRFLDALPEEFWALDPEGFWDAALALLPREGDWFPRVDARTARAPELIFRLRPAPERRASIRLVTAERDPRTAPRAKGPDLAAMTALRTAAQGLGADEAVVLDADGSVAEGSTTCLLWWRGDMLCVPEEAIERIDSVTLRSILALATALGIDVLHERATPDDLDGLEIWAVNALHGVRIVTEWVGGPAPAELPGRRAAWQTRLDALRRPLPLHAVPSAVASPASPATPETGGAD